MTRFDPRVHQPHPPGYFLYIYLGRLLNVVCHDANLALVWLSIGASCGAVVVVYLLALEWFGPRAALFAGLLFLCSPLAWFHGTVALTYIVEALFSGLVGYACWPIYCGRRGFAIPAAILLGLSAGIRPSSLLFLSPLFLFSMRRATLKERWWGFAALAITLASWFVPMLHASGGAGKYFDALISLWRMVPSKETVFTSSPATSIARAFTVAFILLLSFGAAALAPLGFMYLGEKADAGKTRFTLVWIAPALAFFTFGYLRFVNSGYLLLVVMPGCVWLGYWAAAWYDESSLDQSLRLTIVATAITVNILIFLEAPFYCSYRQVRRFEADMKQLQTELPSVASPGDTLMISFDSHFDGFRHAGYYFPDYFEVEYPEVRMGEGPMVFVMRHRDTELVAHLPLASYHRFVLFPLPVGSRYEVFLRSFKERLPAGSLKTVTIGGRDFVTGPIADLPLLFPDAAPVH